MILTFSCLVSQRLCLKAASLPFSPDESLPFRTQSLQDAEYSTKCSLSTRQKYTSPSWIHILWKPEPKPQPARLAWLALQEWADNGCPVWQHQQYLAICFSASHSLKSNTLRAKILQLWRQHRHVLYRLIPLIWYHTFMTHTVYGKEATLKDI